MWNKKGGYTSEGRAARSIADPGSNYDSEDRAGTVQEYTSKKHKYVSVVFVSAGVTTFESGAYSLKINKKIQNFLQQDLMSEHPEALGDHMTEGSNFVQTLKESFKDNFPELTEDREIIFLNCARLGNGPRK